MVGKTASPAVPAAAAEPRPSRSRTGTRTGSYPALDGLRAVAVLTVMLYHFGYDGMRGGLLGVDVFFVLSGYLITGQLVTRWVLGDAVSFRSFWMARGRRLLPALVLMLAGTTAAVVLLDRDQLTLFRGDLGAAATYSSNWWYIFHQRSYFVAAGRPPVLQHLWSLAVEEQFYLIWPVVVAGVVVMCARPATRLRALLAAAIAVGIGSSLVMGIGSAVTGAPGLSDPSRWYFGTDSHVMGLMAGAALAVYRRGDGLGARLRAPLPTTRPGATFIGALAFGVLLLVLSQTDEFAPWLYRVGFAAVSVLTAVVIAVVTRPGPLTTVLDRPILRAIGRRSYAIYLWHWPVACFTRPGIDLPISFTTALVLRTGLTLLLAEISYRWVEEPIRREGWHAYWRRVAHVRVGSFRAPTVIGGVAAALVAGVVLPASATPVGPELAGNGTVYVSRPGDPGSVHVQSRGSRASGLMRPAHPGAPSSGAPSSTGNGAAAAPGGHLPPGVAPTPGQLKRPPHENGPRSSHQTPGGHQSSDGRHRTSGDGGSPATGGRPGRGRAGGPGPPGHSGLGDLRSYDLIVYGDSVPLGAIPDLAARFHSVTNDAVEGVQSWTLLPRLTAAAATGRYDGDVVLLHTGDNGLISPDQLRAALSALSGAARVVLAVPYVPRSWQSDNQATVRAVAGDYPNVVLMDWETTARTHPTDLWSDGIHLTPTGEQAYASMVAAAVARH